MENPNSPRQLSAITLQNNAYAAKQRRCCPRIKHGIKLYASGAVKTQREAAAIVGVSTVGLGRVISRTPIGQAEMERIDGEVRTRIVDLSAVIEGLGERAVRRIASLMDGDGVKHEVQLKAAQDLLDRNPTTSKMRKLSVESLSLTGKDVETLVRAMTSSTELKEIFPQAAIGDFTPGVDEAQR